MHQYKGKLIIHTGSMFSGKTSSLEKDIKRFTIAGYNTVAFKPTLDTRYENSEIITHDKICLQAHLVKDVYEMKKFIEIENPEVIGIDEVQFLGGEVKDIIECINTCLKKDITVVLAGLDMDFSGKAFEVVKELMPIADYLHKHHAVCASCGTDAWISNRKIKDQERIVIGAVNEYEPLCRKCYFQKNAE